MSELFIPGISVRLIQHLVGQHYRVPVDAMTSPNRRRVFAHPRQLAMALAAEFTTQPLTDIGRRFGGRDHSTVWHAMRVVAMRDESDPDVHRDRAALRAMLDHLKPRPTEVLECVA